MHALTHRDVAAGYPLPAATSPRRRPTRTSRRSSGEARAALSQAVVQPLASDRRVTVAFSGGRDSTLVLAAAVSTARRYGLPDPVPVTQVWPALPSLDESAWQELVVRHLGLADWQKVDMGGDGELLGDASVESLRRHGLLWPAPAHTKRRFWESARGAHMLTGEGGDQIFGPPRVRPLHHWRRAARDPGAWAKPMLRGALPGPALRTRLLDIGSSHRPWLRPGFAHEVARARRLDEATQPLPASRAVRWLGSDPAITAGLETLDRCAARQDVIQHHPLLAPDFLEDLSRDAGLWGWPDRTRAMTAVADDLVPPALLRRTSKVDFGEAVWGDATRSWLARWDGVSGVDADLVDADALRREWSSARPHPGTALMAHAAWLAQEVGVRAAA